MMKRLLLLLPLVCFIGCSAFKSDRLSPGGAYAPTDTNGAYVVQPDLQFYQVELAYKLAFTAADTVFTFEKDNRSFIQSFAPQFKIELDKIRPAAWQANMDYHTARKIYEANPVPVNLDAMSKTVAKLKQLSAAATTVVGKYLTSTNNPSLLPPLP